MSKLQVDDIVNKEDTGSAGFSKGLIVNTGSSSGITTINSSGVNVSGYCTAAYFVGDGSGLVNVATNSAEGFDVRNNGNIVGTATTIDFGSNLDVSPASVGFVTITTGDNITATSVVIGPVGSATTIDPGGVNVTGIVTATSVVIGPVGSATTIDSSGVNVTGIVTASGGVNVTGIVTASGGFNIGIQSAGTDVATGVITALNFIGAGNTFVYDSSSKTIDISITGGGSDTTHLIWLTGGG